MQAQAKVSGGARKAAETVAEAEAERVLLLGLESCHVSPACSAWKRDDELYFAAVAIATSPLCNAPALILLAATLLPLGSSSVAASASASAGAAAGSSKKAKSCWTWNYCTRTRVNTHTHTYTYSNTHTHNTHSHTLIHTYAKRPSTSTLFCMCLKINNKTAATQQQRRVRQTVSEWERKRAEAKKYWAKRRHENRCIRFRIQVKFMGIIKLILLSR